VIAALALSATLMSATADYHVVLNARIGPYRDYLHGKYGRAVSVFGKPSSRGALRDSNFCTVRWRRLGLDMDFVGSLAPCTPAHLRAEGWYGATFHSRRWIVHRGLRVGDSVARMRRLYPKAKFSDAPPEDPRWDLVRVPYESGTLPLISATSWEGKVTSISIYSGTVF
jgi:hypothetical protein